MGYMKSVDIVLTAHKLSEPQKNAVVELLSGGFNTAKPNTIKALVNKGLIIAMPGEEFGWNYAFSADFETELREAYSQPEAREEESIESLLQGDPWKMGDAIVSDEPFLVMDSDGVVKSTDKGPEAPLAGWELRVMAENLDQFEGDVLAMIEEYKRTVQGWKGTEVWDGLSLEEIKEDIETAYPVGRQARRVHHRTLRNAFRRLAVSQSPETRKSIKITGKVGV